MTWRCKSVRGEPIDFKVTRPSFSGGGGGYHPNRVPRAFPLKNGWGHFLREKPWGRGWVPSYFEALYRAHLQGAKAFC